MMPCNNNSGGIHSLSRRRTGFALKQNFILIFSVLVCDCAQNLKLFLIDGRRSDLQGKSLKVRYVLSKCCSGARGLAVLSLLMLVAALVARYGLMESGWLPAECGGTLSEGVQGWCGAKWVLIQSFLNQRMGWVSLVAGVLAFVTRRKDLALIGWFCGIAGLVLYSFDYAAVGAVLSLLVLARQLAQEGNGKQQADRDPGDGLGIERL